MKICFFMHDLSQGGANRSLWSLLRENDRLKLFQPVVVSLADGPMGPDIRSYAELRILPLCNDGLPRPYAVTGGLRGIRRAGRLMRGELSRRWLRRQGFDLLVLNSLAALPFLRWLPEQTCPAVLYARETGVWVDFHVSGEDLQRIKRRVSGYIANSELTRDDLADRLGLEPAKILLAPPTIETNRADIPDRAAARTSLLARLGLPDSFRLVAACGALAFHKGPDLFVNLALHMRRSHPDTPVGWVWVGGQTDTYFAQTLTADIRKAGLDDRVFLLGQFTDALPLLAGADVLAMVSREEPFGRVVIEAASVGTPAVCFDTGCGAATFVGRGAGVVTPYLDCTEMTSAIHRLLADEPERNRLGLRAQCMALEAHGSRAASPAILGALRNFALHGSFTS
jgi:glycosyltransferase involved in cell wall biosynthesis